MPRSIAILMADLIVLLHFAFVLFVVLGGLLALRWPRVAWLHIPAVIWGALVEFTGWICPLTPLENRLRRASGETSYQGDFIAHYILPALYPNGLTRRISSCSAAIALAVNFAIYALVVVRHRRSSTQRHMIGTHELGSPRMAGVGANCGALAARDRGRVCDWAGREAIVATRLVGLARRTGSRWIDPAVEAVARRVPFWSVLVGDLRRRWVLDSSRKFAIALDKGLYVVAAASLTFLVSEVLVKFVRVHGPVLDPSQPTTTLTENLVRIVVVILGLLVILAGLDLQITPILTALGVGGLAVALALQDTLANLFAGFYLTVAKHIRIGNYIKLSSGEEGYLVDIDWRASRLRQLANNTVLVPNAKFSQSIVTNYDSARSRDRRHDRGERRLCERSRSRGSHHDRGRARRDAYRARAACPASIRSCGSIRSATLASAFP